MQSPDDLAVEPAASIVPASGSSTLVVLPGLDGTDVFSRPFIAALPGGIRTRVVCYPTAGTTHRYEDLLPLARAAVSDLPDCYVLGSSFGGPLALMLAHAEAARIKGVVLAATYVTPPVPRIAPLRFAVVGPLVWTLRAARRIPIWLRDPRDPLRRAKAETWSRVPAGSLAARARAALATDAREALRECRAPILSVSFRNDRLVPPSYAAEILRLCPAARHVTLPGGHLGMFSEPAALAAAVSRFIEDVEAVPRAARPSQP